MDWKFAFAAVGAAAAVLSMIATVITARRAARSRNAVDIGREVVGMQEFRDKVTLITAQINDDAHREVLAQAATIARTIVADQLQLHLNRYVSVPQFDALVDRIDRLENRFDSLPAEVGQRVDQSLIGVNGALQTLLSELRRRP